MSADGFAAIMEPVARHLLGEPNAAFSNAKELRWGNQGSLSVNIKGGEWYSHEADQGGGVLDLIVFQGEAKDRHSAATWLKANGYKPETNDKTKPPTKRGKIVKTYDYLGEDGALLFQVCRMDTNPKTFVQRRPAASGGWEWKKGTRQVPYKLPLLLEADPAAPVFIVEGEKDADRVTEAGLIATCNAMGAGKWPAALVPFFKGRRVVILPDNDEPGREHAAKVFASLQGVAESVRVLDLAQHWPAMPHKGDISDWLDKIGTPSELLTLAESAQAVSAQANDDLPEHRKVVAELNQSHALVLTGDKVVVLRETIGERDGKEVLYLSTGAFKTWYMNRTAAIETTDRNGKATTKHVPISDLWLKSPERRQYEGVTFAPANNAPSSYYNLWSGFTAEPIDCTMARAAMKCRRLLSHMKFNLCGGNKRYFRYLLAWAADMVQDPDRKKGVALVMRGLKGTGKSTFAEALSALLGRHAMSVSHMRHLAGNFNRHLADKLLIVAEESYWAGDKADEGPLKHMITSDRLTIEAKGIDAVEMPSLCRIMMITNNEWAAPASSDERRYFVLDVSDRHRQDFAYFQAIKDQLDRGGLSALLTLLLKFPLHSVQLRQVPETEALRKQRALSLEPHDQFVFDAITDGVWHVRDENGLPAVKEWGGELDLSKDELYEGYIESSRKRGKLHLLDKARFGKKFMQSTGAKPSKPRGAEGGRVPSYRVPEWSVAVANFKKCCGVDVELLEEEAPY